MFKFQATGPAQPSASFVFLHSSFLRVALAFLPSRIDAALRITIDLRHNIIIMLVEIEASIDGTSSYNILFDEPKAKHCLDQTRRRSPVKVQRTNCYIRAQDLKLTDENLNISKSEHALIPLDGGGLEAVMNGLVTIGLKEATDESNRWSATSSTDKILTKRHKNLKNGVKMNEDSMGSWKNAASGRDVLVWSSKCTRPGHGSEYPVVKARGLIPASASEVVDLLRDSSKVVKYNKMSIGRVDQFVFTQQGNTSVHSLRKCPLLGVVGEVKIMSSKSQPPLVRKPLEFKTLFYARRLDKRDDVEFDSLAYITVGRSIWETPEGTTGGADSSTTRCEILLSVNLVREVTTASGIQCCELTNITHAVSPGVPMFLGKQMGLMAAENYIKDIRALFEKQP
ncbi:hypothetical protein ACHAW6_003382 [Cyclotella cf. meneghiniana]